ncbi:hypothetical protein [Okeania sp. KiyG1]|uniref:hypothetical protein n=1 Tax=Okeania sp. KiyG1 TaxID=2720165 RepID=UPI0019212B22|nr:hypothetical protein [Okeania sp. KiyG1]
MKIIANTKRDKCLLQMVGMLHSPYERRKKEEGRGEKYFKKGKNNRYKYLK